LGHDYVRLQADQVAPPVHDAPGLPRHAGVDRPHVRGHSQGLPPTQDTGLILGLSQAGQDVSPEKLRRLHIELTRLIERDPDIATVGSAFGGGNGTTPNTGRFFIGLKPHDQRKASATQVINRLRPQLASVEGVVLFLQPLQDISVGGRIARGQYQYTLQDADIDELNSWAQRLLGKLKTLPELIDVASERPAEQRAAEQRATC
jgi:multidrug efflux pump subunit AcrB